MMTEKGSELVQRALQGEASALQDSAFAHIQMSDPDEVLPIQPRAVVRVMRDLQSGVITEETAQRWAFWVRQGFLPGATPRSSELCIEWAEDEFDDAMATSTMRLEELGDVVDGEFRPGEIDELVQALEKPSP